MFTGNIIPNPHGRRTCSLYNSIIFLYEDVHVLKIIKTKLETNNIPHCTICLVKTSTKTHNISLFLFKIFQRNMSPKPRKLSHRYIYIYIYATEVDFEIYDMGPLSPLHGR